MLTAEQITAIAPSIKGRRAEDIAKELNRICPEYGIDQPTILHEFLANLMEECGEFSVFEENMNYSVEALINKFGRHRISEADARKYGYIKGVRSADKVAIANTIYGGAWGKANLGNTKPGDGWKFRGSGAIQLTGRGNITLFTLYYNSKFDRDITVEEMVDLLRTDLVISIHGACWLFAIAKNLIPLAVSDNMQEIIKRINGGYNGAEKRYLYLQRAKAAIK